ncbi:MAG TPA: GEVED domain-containing protein [Flavobacterium sp.]|uniref:GEVED domain-containing protein n=2 Tax=Flavobacterium TaxID=237 RepID=UPI0025C6256B|nr:MULTISPECIES: GEVED domain-containing protein [unclassified Flavobacterium]HRE79072.1 GEVED domain-containing protein [Flavobacterium sp.]
MIKKYNILNQSSKIDVLLSIKKLNTIKYIVVLFVLMFNDLKAQETYTLGDGEESYNTLGVSPFATINRNNRSQYMYYAEELYNAGFNISGNVVSLAINITELGLPTSLKPENIKIKMGMTTSFEMGPNLVNNLPVYYESSVENITELGWYTFELDTPFAWDGFRNIIVEICRSNEDFGTSFSIQGKNFPMGEIVTAANYTNDSELNGCSLPNENLLPELFTRRRPNMQFTMTNPCETTPSGGQTIVTPGPYCSGESFTLSVQNGSIESGLSYQWQSSPNDNGPWSDIPGATDAFYVTSQSISTYYRRATTCDIASSTVFDFPLLVGGEGCYCTSLVVNENAIGITNVTIGSINNSSPSTTAYTNFTAVQTELERESTVNLSANVNTEGGTNYTMAWIDWNQNGEFEMNESFVLGSVTGGSNVSSGVVASFQVPADALLGSTIMRVRTKQSDTSDYPTPCDSIENGEAEDYTVIVTENLSIGEVTTLDSILIIANNTAGIHFKVTEEAMQQIDIFDLSGRLIMNKKVQNETELTISEFHPSNQLFIIKVTLSNGQKIAKKIIY